MKRLLLLLLILSLSSAAFATSIFPDSLVAIEEEAFAGDVSLENLIISEEVTSIGPRAFAETALKTIAIPSSVTDIAGDAFENVRTPMLILTEPGSTAVTYALRSNLDFRADTVCRALVIGQTEYPGDSKLEGPGKDIVKLQAILDGYSVTTATNLTAEEIRNSIASTFSEAKEEDISLFYYSGHGNAFDGALVGIDLTSCVTAAELRAALDYVPGRKIVIVDACYSGGLIRKSTGSSDPAALFVKAFTTKPLRLFSSIAAQQYFVIASSKSDEESWEASYGGIFTDAFVKSRASADEDCDGVVTLQEAYQYTKEKVQQTASAGGKIQTAQVYPENCHWFGLFR